MAGSSFTGPLRIKKSDGTKVEFVDADGDLVVGASIKFGDGEFIVDTNENELLVFGVTASAVNELKVTNAATGNFPILSATGEVNTGINFENSEGEEILILDSVATSVNEITIRSAATGNSPIIASTGEADTGLEFHNDQAEIGLILDYVATAVNHIKVTNAAAAAEPDIAALGTDTDISITLTPKGAGDVGVLGARGIVSSVSNGIVPFIVSAALSTTTDTAAVSVTNYFTNLVTTTASVPTLADGAIKGQLKKIQFITDAGDAVLTPTNLNDGTTITFADIGDTAELLFDGSGWQVLSLYNNADGTTAPVLA